MSLGTYFKRIFNRNVRRSRFAKKHAAPNVSMINQVLPKENSVFVSVPEPETDFLKLHLNRIRPLSSFTRTKITMRPISK